MKELARIRFIKGSNSWNTITKIQEDKNIMYMGLHNGEIAVMELGVYPE